MLICNDSSVISYLESVSKQSLHAYTVISHEYIAISFANLQCISLNSFEKRNFVVTL